VIAVGATSDQVKEFLRRRPNEYEVMADTTSTPKIMAKTTIRSTDVVSGSSPGVFIAGRPNNAEKQAEQTTEEGNRIETLVLSRKVYKDMPTGGKHESYNGVTSTTIIETKKMWAPVEKMTVTITDGVVSGIDRQVQG
jgi:hypothetical protein